MMRLSAKERLGVLLVGAYIAAVLITSSSVFAEARVRVVYAWEDSMYALVPSGERAFYYGERHFNAKDPAMYDISRASRFFTRARYLDPDLPYVYHELARVAFLRGNFEPALALINTQIEKHGEVLPNSYYVRGLILGYMGRYDEAAKDYQYYLEFDPTSWAATNDYAWVLLRSGRPREALDTIEPRLEYWHHNPWLFNSAAIAAYEVGEYEKARTYIESASEAVEGITEKEWLTAYPGNDPQVAGEGIATLKRSIEENMHTIGAALASGTVQ